MRKGLLLSAAGLLLAGSSTAYGACTPVLKCASLGYKYSSSECSGSGVACPFDTSKYFCAEPCTYTVTKATCDSQCKNVGDKGCTKNGTVYYEACGSSKCGADEQCSSGSCVSTCSYTVTESSCSSQCKNTNGTPCTRGGVKYYPSCGNSKCASGQGCYNSTCYNPVATEGWCCGYTNYCGYSGGISSSNDSSCQRYYGRSCYDQCKTYGYPDCSDMIASCRASGGAPVFQRCNEYGVYDGTPNAYVRCFISNLTI